MHYESPLTTATTERITDSVLQCLERLQQKCDLDEAACDDFKTIRNALEAMPLPTDQFGLACTRLKNAQHYLRCTESGAARYELQLLFGSLKNGLTEAREPHRRIRRRAEWFA